MKRLLPIFFFAAIFCSTAINGFSQYISYVDEHLKPATAEKYTYKREIKHVKAMIDPNFGTNVYGQMTSNPQLSGIHFCSLTDYYKTGEVALTGNIVAIDFKCSGWGFDGLVTGYYKNGNVKYKVPMQNGKVIGTAIYWDEKGNETKREEWVDNKLVKTTSSSAPADSSISDTSIAAVIKPCESTMEINDKQFKKYISEGDSKFSKEDYRGAILNYDKALLFRKNWNDCNHRASMGKPIDLSGVARDAANEFREDLYVPNKRGMAKIMVGDKTGACSDFQQTCKIGNEDGCNYVKEYCQR